MYKIANLKSKELPPLHKMNMNKVYGPHKLEKDHMTTSNAILQCFPVFLQSFEHSS